MMKARTSPPSESFSRGTLLAVNLSCQYKIRLGSVRHGFGIVLTESLTANVLIALATCWALCGFNGKTVYSIGSVPAASPGFCDKLGLVGAVIEVANVAKTLRTTKT